MLEIVPITPELLAELGAELGGCDFTDKSRSDFLASMASCDVQAAPGNGKTTLLTAKLALLSRSWDNRSQGVCIISHTNAARTEVEQQISRHPTASQLMAYPHFTGTVTAFVNQFLALPYLHGLGWPIRRIDDDVFAAEAARAMPYYWELRAQAKKAAATVDSWVRGLDLDVDFVTGSELPESLAVHRRKGQHGADTDCGKALARLKASMVKKGIYRYSDMTTLALRALKENPKIAERLRHRFPLVILDEAQDTNGKQLKLLEHLFADGGSAFQRLGDSNQTLYQDDAPVASYWTPGANCIPFDESRRFGQPIADFASRLTTKIPQKIQSFDDKRTLMVVIVFDEKTIGGVLSAFADEARAHWLETFSEKEIWAVASRHNSTGKVKGPWHPKSLVDYYPPYRSEAGTAKEANLLCRQLQKAALLHAAARPPSEVMDIFCGAIAELSRLRGWTGSNGGPITARNLWVTLGRREGELPRKIRLLLHKHILVGNAAWEEVAWKQFCGTLVAMFDSGDGQAVPGEVSDYCSFVGGKEADAVEPARQATKQVTISQATIRLGSIHSVKGKTVDGILVMESEVWKGHAKGQSCLDLATVLPTAFGVEGAAPLSEIGLAAATNVFVAVTRPRELLCLALRKSEFVALAEIAQKQGWKVVDLVKGA
ncbi:UvrD-helicase domain-containing protein [Rhizobium laguerreae]|uniref:UvrD-helicase domain-containing protein n=1 Tax=Rhizobium laguerreae TaxID=1076926 RepID=UPI0014411388|nr:AAA family ATPase [Rhizobium laguerreae]